jgi:hypothetical protein
MDPAQAQTQVAADSSDRRFREQSTDETHPREDATFRLDGALEVSDEDRGRDPYNHTGRFEKNVR